MHIRAYLRASTNQQDANRAKDELKSFTANHGQSIAATYVEHVSGASLRRPELFRLLEDCSEGDILLIEQVDRLSRLNADDWEKLKNELSTRQVRVVSLDLPTSHQFMASSNDSDETSTRIFDAINAMMMDILAAVSRKDYTDRRRRQKQGIAKAKQEGKYRGRPANTKRNAAIREMLEEGKSWSKIMDATGCARATVASVRKGMNATQ